jgi:hypothetical protein
MRIKVCIDKNPLLQGLLQHMSGLSSSDDFLTIDKYPALDDTVLALALDPDSNIDMEGGEENCEGDLVDQLAEKFNFKDD